MTVKTLRKKLNRIPDYFELLIEHEDYLEEFGKSNFYDIVFHNNESCLVVTEPSVKYNKHQQFLINEGYVEIEFNPETMIRGREVHVICIKGLEFNEVEWIDVTPTSNFTMYVIPVQGSDKTRYFIKGD